MVQIRRLYTPLVCLCLLIVAGSLSRSAGFDPLTEAQNKRVGFSTRGSARQNPELSPAEAWLAESVLDPEFGGDKGAVRVLYLSNSHSYAVMDLRPGDLTAAQWLQVFTARQVGHGQPPSVVRLPQVPNLSMPECLIKLVAVGAQSSRPGDVLIGGMVMAEWRGIGVRKAVQSLVEIPAVQERLRQLIRANPDLPHATRALSFVDEIAAAVPTDLPLATRIENQLRSWIETKVPLLRMLPLLYGRMTFSFVTLRNRTFAISSDRARPVPEVTYRSSLELLELALRYTRSKGLVSVIYLAPIRPITPNPNLPSDLARFRRDVLATCQRYGVTSVDYTDAIPENLWTNYPDDGSWGYTTPQRDFAHFTGGAHKLMAEQMMKYAGPLLLGRTSGKGDARKP